LDEVLAAWTREREPVAIECTLQAAGVPASVVQRSVDLCEDPQLLHRGHFVRLEHPTNGSTLVEGSRFKLSRTPARVEGAAPTYGRDNQHVLETILGYDEERITELVIAGALE
jgi:crotonobetainyl-CoA:carnitine CoA-transferase CaiB-like acyl-CoA transferase